MDRNSKITVSQTPIVSNKLCEMKSRYDGYLTTPGKQKGDVPNALRIDNTDRAKRHFFKLKSLQKAFGPLVFVTVYPTQPADLGGVWELLKAMLTRMTTDGLGVARLDASGLIHAHLVLPSGSVAGSCPQCSCKLPAWKRHSWTSHGGRERKGWKCPTDSCGLVWSRVDDLEGCAAYLGSPVDELVWDNPMKAAGRWLLALDKLGKRPRMSYYHRTTIPAAPPFLALNVLLFFAALRKVGKTRRIRPGAPRKPSMTPEAPVVATKPPKGRKRPVSADGKTTNAPPK
jgi:hypothetical protein